MKRHLLETADWAAVGAARPVKVTFTAEEDLERFGKRRRLTMGDHERLNTTRGSPRIQFHQGRRCEGAGNNLSGNGIPEGLEIRIYGRRLGQERRADTDVEAEGVLGEGTGSHPISHAEAVSSQSMSMLLDEESQGSTRNRQLIGTNKLSDARQLDSSDAPFIPDLQLDDRGFPILQPREFSESMEPEPEPLVSNESTGSSIIPRTASPVRRRFTIDNQAIADSQGKFWDHSSLDGPEAGPRIRQLSYYRRQSEYDTRTSVAVSPEPGHSSQLMHDESHENPMRCSFGASLQPGSSLHARGQPDSLPGFSAQRQNNTQIDRSVWSQDDQQEGEGSQRAFMPSSPEAVPSITRPTQPRFGWLPQMHKAPRTQKPGCSQFVEPSISTSSPWPESEAKRLVPERAYGRALRGIHQPGIDQNAAADMSFNGRDTLLHWPKNREKNSSPLRIFGQPVVFEDSDVLPDGHMAGREPHDMVLDGDNTYSSFSSGPLRFPAS
ncbi:hypothetical protein BDV06DRAFT_225682 [Aspergillus oleicola]